MCNCTTIPLQNSRAPVRDTIFTPVDSKRVFGRLTYSRSTSPSPPGVMTKRNSLSKAPKECMFPPRCTLLVVLQVSNSPGDTGGISIAWTVTGVREQNTNEGSTKGNLRIELISRVVTWAMAIVLARTVTDAHTEIAEEDQGIGALCSEAVEASWRIVASLTETVTGDIRGVRICWCYREEARWFICREPSTRRVFHWSRRTKVEALREAVEVIVVKYEDS